MKDLTNLRVDRQVYGGDGMGRLPDGRGVFIPFTIPGELVRANLVEHKRRYIRAVMEEILEESPMRVEPRCGHFTTCGCCQYQHMNYQAQLEVKSTILREQFERIGGFEEIPVVEVIPADDPWYYRNQVQFHLTREGKLGFQQAQSNRTFPIRECHLPEYSINQVWPRVDIEPIQGIVRVSVRAGINDDLMLVLEGTNAQPVDIDIEELAISVVYTVPESTVILAGSGSIVIEVDGKNFMVSAGSFFQVNTAQAEKMVRLIMDNLPLSEKLTVLDVYCGVGLFSAFLAPKVKSLVGIEVSPEACADFISNLDEFENVSLYEAPAEDVLNAIKFQPDAILVDPPRQGLGVKTVEGILAQGAEVLLYVSCDPATLARDARRLSSGGYILNKVLLIDMFPQTYHIESITSWVKS